MSRGDRPLGLMIQGTGSDVGKSLLTAALGRALYRRGWRPAPFKPQNMANNAAVTADGGEIGRAQALQAQACGRTPVTAMNPLLLKPQAGGGSQLVRHGRAQGAVGARHFQATKSAYRPMLRQALANLGASSDILLIEGAGSPAEINLRAGDIANMGFARACAAPVILVGDIDRGGVIAQLVGTWTVLPPADRACLAGFIINRFRGDPTLFAEGAAEITNRTGLANLGIVPHCAAAADLPAEDSMGLSRGSAAAQAPTGKCHIAVLQLGHIANFDDIDPLAAEPDLQVTMVPPGTPVPVCDLVIIPGSKAVLADLNQLQADGWATDIIAHHRRGGWVLGLCGGYQMLGQSIADPDGLEGTPGTASGLGLLDITTQIAPTKTLRPIKDAHHAATGAPLSGYEMHMGITGGPATAQPFAIDADGRGLGAVSPDGRIMGVYLHGVFANGAFRAAFLAALGARSAGDAHGARVEAALDALAAHLETHLAIDRLLGLAAPLDLPDPAASATDQAWR